MTQKVLTQVDDAGNATVALNRPDVHNAFDPEMGVQLITALKKLEADPKVRAVVLMGQGKSFSAGADIEHMKKSAKFTKEQNLKAALASAQIFHTLYTLNKPTIARVHGAVRGGGVGLVAACDIAIGSRDATFRLSEVRLGIVPAMISPYVVAAIGERYARRYFVSGEEFDSAEAFRIGLLHDIVEARQSQRADRGHAVAGVLRRPACHRRRETADQPRCARGHHRGRRRGHRQYHRRHPRHRRSTGRAFGVPRKTQSGVDRTGAAEEEKKALTAERTKSRINRLAMFALIFLDVSFASLAVRLL